jgi:hypothetical protein
MSKCRCGSEVAQCSGCGEPFENSDGHRADLVSTPLSDEPQTVPVAIREEAKYPHASVWVEYDGPDPDDEDDKPWMLHFQVIFLPSCQFTYVVSCPDTVPLSKWRRLAAGKGRVCDINDDNGCIVCKGGQIIFDTGTNARETTQTSSTTALPHAMVAGALTAALDNAVRLGLPFVTKRVCARMLGVEPGSKSGSESGAESETE